MWTWIVKTHRIDLRWPEWPDVAASSDLHQKLAHLSLDQRPFFHQTATQITVQEGSNAFFGCKVENVHNQTVSGVSKHVKTFWRKHLGAIDLVRTQLRREGHQNALTCVQGDRGLGSIPNAGKNASKKSKLHAISPGDRIFRSSQIQTRILGTTEGALDLCT